MMATSRMLAALERLAEDRGLSDAAVVVQHSYWTPLAERFAERPGQRGYRSGIASASSLS